MAVLAFFFLNLNTAPQILMIFQLQVLNTAFLPPVTAKRLD